MLSHIKRKNYKRLDKEIKATLSEWKKDTITTGISPSFHKATLTLDAPPILNPPDLAAIGLTDICVLSFTIDVEPFIPTTAILLDPSQRPPIVQVICNFCFISVSSGVNSRHDNHDKVHILDCWPPSMSPENQNFTVPFTQPRDICALPFKDEEQYLWKFDYYGDGDRDTGFLGKKTISVVLRLPPGNNIETSTIVMHGHLRLTSRVWNKKWKWIGYKQHLDHIHKSLYLVPPIGQVSELKLRFWNRRTEGFFPFETCDVYTMGKAIGWEGAVETQGTINLTPELTERHHGWIATQKEKYDFQIPHFNSYADITEERRARAEAIDKMTRDRRSNR